MRSESLVNRDWAGVVARLGGAEALKLTARQTKAFVRAREIGSAVDLLRLIMAYCLGEQGLRSTAAWATSVGLVDISCVALLYRLRQCGDWLALLVGQTLAGAAPKASQSRLIRIVDATTVRKKGPQGRNKNGVWRVHSAFDLPQERFGHFELTDQQEGERLDRIAPVAGEIHLADRAYLQPERMARLIEAGADFVIRAGWKGARWLDDKGCALDLIAELRKATKRGLLDRPIWIKPKRGAPLALRYSRRQEATTGCSQSEAQGSAERAEGRSSALRTNASGCRLGDPGHLTCVERLRNR